MASDDELSASSCGAALNGGYVDKRDAFVSAGKEESSGEDLLIGMCCSIKGVGSSRNAKTFIEQCLRSEK